MTSDRDRDKLERSPQDVGKWKRAQQLVMSGRNDAALAEYRDLLARYPGLAQLWFENGIAAAGELQFAAADESFLKAAELAPRDVDLLVLIGQQQHRLRRFDHARTCFEQAVAAEPASVHARLSLAAWLERERKLDAALACVDECLARHPRDPQARSFRAFLLQRQGRNEDAEKVLRELVKEGSKDPSVEFSSKHLLGVVLDELGHHSEAWRWLVESKAALRRTADMAAFEKMYDRADRQRRELLSALTPDAVKRWATEGPPVPHAQQLAFLGGHPRSGTTLLEQILGAHPGVLGFDEPEAFVLEISNRLAPMQADRKLTADALNRLGTTARANLAQRYFKSLLQEPAAATDARVLLDKNPSPTAWLHLWLRVFPELKVIIALRDPRDVAVSCFFQNMNGLTATNANFLTIERTARHYADLMDVWLRMRELGGFEWIETRYEDVVANLEAEGRRVTQFTGLDWHPSQANYRDAAAKKILHAPTYHDVTKPVYRRAIGRWERYAAELAPIQERLEPYCKAFGYA